MGRFLVVVVSCHVILDGTHLFGACTSGKCERSVVRPQPHIFESGAEEWGNTLLSDIHRVSSLSKKTTRYAVAAAQRAITLSRVPHKQRILLSAEKIHQVSKSEDGGIYELMIPRSLVKQKDSSRILDACSQEMNMILEKSVELSQGATHTQNNLSLSSVNRSFICLEFCVWRSRVGV